MNIKSLICFAFGCILLGTFCSCKKEGYRKYHCFLDCSKLKVSVQLKDSTINAHQKVGKVPFRIMWLYEPNGGMWVNIEKEPELLMTGITNEEGLLNETIKVDKDDFDGRGYIGIIFSEVGYRTGTIISRPVLVAIKKFPVMGNYFEERYIEKY